MKTIFTFFISAFVSLSIYGQTAVASSTLLPDQNPNFEKSRSKYMADSNNLIASEGQTIQQTYKAIDDVEAKKERKELASQRRHERRMARIQARGNRNRYYYNDYDYYYGYQGYRSPYGFYRPGYYSGQIYNNVNSVLNTALLGLTIWSILKH